MKIFLTGATGVIGSHLVKRLVKLGNEVSILVRADSELKVLLGALGKVKIHHYDGSYDSLRIALESENPSVVCHIASFFLVTHKSEDIIDLIESNILLPTLLLEAMSKTGIKNFINTGTSWQNYQNEKFNPVNLYAATKQAFEDMQSYYINDQKLKSITLKLFDTYGPGDTRKKLFYLLRKTAKSGEILLMSPGEQKLNLVYIDDVIDAFILALKMLPTINTPKTFGIASQDSFSLKEIVNIYSKVVGKTLNINWGGKPYREREVFEPWTKFENVPGWQAKITLENGIAILERDAEIGGLLLKNNTNLGSAK